MNIIGVSKTLLDMPKITISLNTSLGQGCRVSKIRDLMRTALSNFPPPSLELKAIVLLSGYSQPHCLTVMWQIKQPEVSLTDIMMCCCHLVLILVMQFTG